MLYRELITVCSEIHTKHTNTQINSTHNFSTIQPDNSQFWSNTSKYKQQQRQTHCHTIKGIEKQQVGFVGN
jgi:hypothetical protein